MVFEARADGRLRLAKRWVRCAIGRCGVTPAAAKREGDGKTPAGVYPVRRVLFRADRTAAPRTALPVRPISPEDGWCDDAKTRDYNRPVRLPYSASCETLWREDGLYDLVVVLGHNDSPPVPGRGSAIFLHLAKPGYPPTEGCLALAGPDMEAFLRLARPGDSVRIR